MFTALNLAGILPNPQQTIINLRWLSRLIIASWFLTGLSASGQVRLAITARVDTNQANVRNIYRLLANYLNSHPDSLYNNPYWRAMEVQEQVVQRHERVDLASPFMFFDMTAKQTLTTYQPTLLSVEPVESKYVIRILLYAQTPPKWVTDSHWNPPFILRYYAARATDGQWKLENCWSNELTTWRTHSTPWITFHYPPTFKFDPARAQQASVFCDSLSTALHLADAKPFDYYVMNSEEELGRLFNFDYWLAYNTGFTQKMYNRTFSARGREQHLHEFVHMLYHPVANYFLAEGIATYFGGVDGYTPYQQTLHEVAQDLIRQPKITFEDIYANKFKYPTNSNPRYAAGALVYALVAARHGASGFAQLEASGNTYASLLAHLAPLLGVRESQVEATLMRALRSYATSSTPVLRAR